MDLAQRSQGRLPIVIGGSAILLGLLLVGLLAFVYTLVQRAAVTLVHDQAQSFVAGSVRRFNPLGRPPTNDDLQRYVADQQAVGLRYMALWRPQTGIIIEAGQALEPLTNEVIAALPPERPEFIGDRRVRVRMGPPDRPNPGPPGHGGPPPEAAWPPPDRPGAPPGARRPPPPPGAWDGPPPEDLGPPPDGPPPPGGPHPPQAVMEFEPLYANQLHSYALLSLGVGLAVVAFVLGGAAVLAFLVRRQAELTQRIEHAKRLSALGEMAAVIAHEIRNPLTALKGHAQLLRKSLAGDPRDEKAGRVVGEAIRLQTYLDDLLEFARSGAIEPQPVDPAQVLHDSAESTQAERIDVHTDGAPRVWRLDATRMQQAIANILRNALQVSPPEAHVEARVFAENGHLVFEVRDHGPGISPGDEERIFEPFYTRKARGTGLGLSLAQRIVAQHHGTISARNDPTGGAIFRIALENL